MTTLLSTAYWPNLMYLYHVMHSETIFIEQHDHYQKQSFRNRTQIYSANGLLNLSIPIKNCHQKIVVKDVEISYSENWQLNHWRAITSAYKNSPYFDFFETEIESFYNQPYLRLLDFNVLQLQTIFKLLRFTKKIEFTTEYLAQANQSLDLRETIHPKLPFESNAYLGEKLSEPYYQTFEYKHGFKRNLSILDLLFNKGLESLTYFGIH